MNKPIPQMKKDELILTCLDRYAYAEYGEPLTIAQRKSFGAKREFSNLLSILTELVDRVEWEANKGEQNG